MVQLKRIITPVKLLANRRSKEAKADPVDNAKDSDVEDEERMEAAPEKAESKAEETRAKDESSKKSEEEQRDAPEKEEVEKKKEEEEEKQKEEEDFNRLVDPEVEERVLVLTESVDDLRAELEEFKRESSIERERLIKEVESTKEELRKVQGAPPISQVAVEENSVVETKPMLGVVAMLADQFDDEGYMKCMLSNQ